MHSETREAARRVARLGQRPAWHDRARCAETDPEMFFPENGESARPAKRVCAGCEVAAECLQDALDRGERFGVWGGLSERERRVLPSQPAPGAGLSLPRPGDVRRTGGVALPSRAGWAPGHRHRS